MAVLKSASLTVLALVLTGITANAQIQQDTLQPANTYDAGVLAPLDGGLGPDLWQGISAQRAIHLLENIDNKASPSAKDMIRAVILSGGVPPHAQDGLEREHYIAARLTAILTTGNTEAFQQITERSSLDMNSPVTVKLGVEHALLKGDIQNACLITDNVTTERKAPYWAKLRSYCHYMRGEIPAAELTADLLQRAGHEDETFFALLGYLTGSRVKFPKANTINTALHISMAQQAIKAKNFKAPNPDYIKTYPAPLAAALTQDETQSPAVRLAALIRGINFLGGNNINLIISQFADTPLESIANLPKKNWKAIDWGQALNALRQSTDMNEQANLAAAVLAQAERQGIFEPISNLITTQVSQIPLDLQAKTNPKVFARLAIHNRDIATLGGIYLEMTDDNPLKTRIALASDALGGGFMLGDLGIDIETRLRSDGTKKERAVRDAYLAYGLGAKLSDTAIDILQTVKKMKGEAGNPGALLALSDAAKRRAQAETALRAAHILGKMPTKTLRPDTLSAILSALNHVSLGQISGQLAAYDFLEISR